LKEEMQKHFLDVYIAEIPKDKGIDAPLIPCERELEVRSVKSESVKREKYFVWQLLVYALEHSLGVDVSDAELRKLETGKWVSSVCEISLSHGGGMLAVAVSDMPVGVDVDAVRPLVERFASRALSINEQNRLQSLRMDERETHIVSFWCAKEAVFKKRGDASWVPSSIDTVTESVCVRLLDAVNTKTVLAVASDELHLMAVHRVNL
jgi:phosphopantetheine--protein transferase-like protein